MCSKNVAVWAMRWLIIHSLRRTSSRSTFNKPCSVTTASKHDWQMSVSLHSRVHAAADTIASSTDRLSYVAWHRTHTHDNKMTITNISLNCYAVLESPFCSIQLYTYMPPAQHHTSADSAKPDHRRNIQICTNAMSHLILLRAMPHYVWQYKFYQRKFTRKHYELWFYQNIHILNANGKTLT